MINGTNVQIDSLAASESPLDRGEPFVGSYSVLSRELRLWNVGSDHVDTVKRRFRFNAFCVALECERSLGNIDQEVLRHLEAVNDFTDS